MVDLETLLVVFILSPPRCSMFCFGAFMQNKILLIISFLDALTVADDFYSAIFLLIKPMMARLASLHSLQIFPAMG